MTWVLMIFLTMTDVEFSQYDAAHFDSVEQCKAVAAQIGKTIEVGTNKKIEFIIMPDLVIRGRTEWGNARDARPNISGICLPKSEE